MSSDGPNKSSGMPGWAKWLLGCSAALLLVACVAGSLVVFGLYKLGEGIGSALQAMHKEQIDQLYKDGLASGNPDSVYEQADPAFKAQYSLEEWQRFVQDHRDLFDRGKLDDARTAVRHRDGSSYRMLQVDLPDGEVVKLIFRVIGAVLVLVGVAPTMDAVLPDGLLAAFERPQSSGGGFDFDD